MDTAHAYVELLERSLVDLLGPSTDRAVWQADGSLSIEPVPEAERPARVSGEDWPANGLTMVGLERLENVRRCVRQVIEERVPGDLIETGVWRGGTGILMRALLDVYGDTDRRVWLADSFAGLPSPNPTDFPADRDFEPYLDRDKSMSSAASFLAVSLDQVRLNFERYGYLDSRVQFVEGWFRDTLPTLSDRKWAVLRLDGDLYESTVLALENLYPGLAEGGFVIVDDYGTFPSCRRAVDDYRRENEIDHEICWIDEHGVFWRKGSPHSSGGAA